MTNDEKRRLRSLKPYDAPLGLLGIVVEFVRTHLKSEIGALGLLLLAACVATLVAGASAPHRAPKPIALFSVPLTAESIELWSLEATLLADQRDEEQVTFPPDSLPAFIAWGSAEPEALRAHLAETTSVDFLSTCQAISNARRKIRELIAFEMRWEEIEKQGTGLEERVGANRMPSPPPLSAREKADIEAYETHAATLEQALYTLFPTLPDLAPEELLSEVNRNPDENQPESRSWDPSQRITWRVVNRSRHGPRVLRAR